MREKFVLLIALLAKAIYEIENVEIDSLYHPQCEFIYIFMFCNEYSFLPYSEFVYEMRESIFKTSIMTYSST
jgi:hypothetical protein